MRFKRKKITPRGDSDGHYAWFSRFAWYPMYDSETDEYVWLERFAREYRWSTWMVKWLPATPKDRYKSKIIIYDCRRATFAN